MIVEFFGEPGSGKTTLLKNVAAFLGEKAEYIRPLSYGSAVGHFALFIVLHPRDAFFWLRAALGQRELLRYKLGLLARTMATLQKAALSHSEVVLVDEGLLQRALSVYESALSPEETARMREHARYSKCVVVCRGGDFSRFTSEPDRFNSPRVRQGPERLARWMEIVRTNASRIEAILEREGSAIGVDARAEGAPHGVASRLRAMPVN